MTDRNAGSELDSHHRGARVSMRPAIKGWCRSGSNVFRTGNKAAHSAGYARWRLMLDTIATLAMLFTCVLILRPALFPRTAKLTRDSKWGLFEPVSLEGAATLGVRSARLGIVEYSDFTCPSSARFARDTLPELRRSHIDTGKVLFAFRHLPLQKIHPTAIRAAEAVECAGAQGHFWEMHDRIFENPADLLAETLTLRLGKPGFNAARFEACVNGGWARARIRRDAAEAARLGVTATPTFLVGTVEKGKAVKVTGQISGAAPHSTFARLLDELISRGAER